MSEPYFDPESELARLGGEIYREALDGRRGFRPDQIGIDESDDIWTEIFEDMGQVAAAQTRKEVREALEGALNKIVHHPDAWHLIFDMIARLDAEERKP